MKVSTDGVKLAIFTCNSLTEELGEKAMLLRDALGVTRGEMVSLIGAGGKTTTMFRLAKEMRDQSCKVLVTTTTKIVKPTKPADSPAEMAAAQALGDKLQRQGFERVVITSYASTEPVIQGMAQ